MSDSLLVIEDEPLLGAELCDTFAEAGWDVQLARNLSEARHLLLEAVLDPLIVLSDMSLPDGNALDLLEEVRKQGVPGEWILLTAYGGVPESVRALKLGAFDFLQKPCDPDRLNMVVEGAARSARAQRRLLDQGASQEHRYPLEAFGGRSAAARRVRNLLSRLASTPISTLLITGETGTGKGLAARILHYRGPRAAGPLVELNCAALPHDLLEAEMFGHEAGAFTGAKGRRRGLIEQADGGTLFLDELGELELGLQAKLLRAIEDRRIRRIGGEREIEVDVQILAATNQRLEQRVAEGAFRADLYHRLAVFRLELPPLRERKEDLRDLVPTFVDEFNVRAGKRVTTIPDAVWERLEAYDWPGNVRELRNVVERCVLLAEDDTFPEQWLYLPGRQDDRPSPVPTQGNAEGLCVPLDGSMTLDEIEKTLLAEALHRNGDNVSQTARVLGTTREKLRYRVQKFGLQTRD